MIASSMALKLVRVVEMLRWVTWVPSGTRMLPSRSATTPITTASSMRVKPRSRAIVCRICRVPPAFLSEQHDIVEHAAGGGLLEGQVHAGVGVLEEVGDRIGGGAARLAGKAATGEQDHEVLVVGRRRRIDREAGRGRNAGGAAPIRFQVVRDAVEHLVLPVHPPGREGGAQHADRSPP